jgi:hypothetical protein
MDFIAPMLVLVTGALVIGSIFRYQIVNRRLRENARVWADVQAKVIDKFGSADEVVRYLESDAGKRLLEGQTNGAASPHARILDSIHIGLLVLLGGIGLWLSKGAFSGKAPEFLQVVGTLAIVLGVGFLASAYVSWNLLSRWGLLAKPAESDSVSERG